jgi:hypothetical protein
MLFKSQGAEASVMGHLYLEQLSFPAVSIYREVCGGDLVCPNSTAGFLFLEGGGRFEDLFNRFGSMPDDRVCYS